MKGSNLGRAYTWAGLQNKKGVTYDKNRDGQAVGRAIERFRRSDESVHHLRGALRRGGKAAHRANLKRTHSGHDKRQNGLRRGDTLHTGVQQQNPGAFHLHGGLVESHERGGRENGIVDEGNHGENMDRHGSHQHRKLGGRYEALIRLASSVSKKGKKHPEIENELKLFDEMRQKRQKRSEKEHEEINKRSKSKGLDFDI